MPRYDIFEADGTEPVDTIVCGADLIGSLLTGGRTAVLVGDTDRPISALRVEAIAAINATVGAIRRRFITDISGQEMLYLQKRDEARAWIAAWTPEADPEIEAYPLIAAEVGITAPTAHDLAQLWLNLSALYVGVAAGLETARLTAVYAIETATDADEIAAARTAFETTLNPT